jgi:phosphoketolase
MAAGGPAHESHIPGRIKRGERKGKEIPSSLVNPVQRTILETVSTTAPHISLIIPLCKEGLGHTATHDSAGERKMGYWADHQLSLPPATRRPKHRQELILER